MRKDAVFTVLRNDHVAQELARKLMQHAGHSIHQVSNVRARLRNMQICKDNASLRSATSSTLFSLLNFRAVIEAVKSVTGYCVHSHEYKAPATAVHLGPDVRRCAELLNSTAIQGGDTVTADGARAFAGLCVTDWNDEISGGARSEIETRKMNNPKLLPMTSDVMKLTTHLRETQTENFTVVQQKCYDGNFVRSFKMLSDATLAQLILFNRRKQGEVRKLTVQQYADNAQKVRRYADVEDCLSELEKKLYSFFTRIEIRGKRGKHVPLPLTADQKTIMEYLASPEMRLDAGINEENLYVFAATKGSVVYVRGHDVLRQFANSCDTEHPRELRSSNFRKHVADLEPQMP